MMPQRERVVESPFKHHRKWRNSSLWYGNLLGTHEVPALTTKPFSGAKVKTSVLVPVPANTSVIVSWNTEAFDTDNYHAAGSTRLTAPVAGKYLIAYHISWSDAGGCLDSWRQISLLVNGASVKSGNYDWTTCQGNISASLVLQAAAGDYFEVSVAQDPPGMEVGYVDTNSWFSIVYLGN